MKPVETDTMKSNFSNLVSAVVAMGSETEIEGPAGYPGSEATEMTTETTSTETTGTNPCTETETAMTTETIFLIDESSFVPAGGDAPPAKKARKPRKAKAAPGAEAVQAVATVKAPRARKEKAPKLHKGGADNGYPFLSKKQIVARIAEDAGFATQCLLILDARQTDDEQEEGETKYKNRAGWQSSHAKQGSGLAAKYLDGGLDQTETSQVQALVSLYRKQLSSHFRQVAIDNDPALAQKAAAFFTPQPTGPGASN